MIDGGLGKELILARLGARCWEDTVDIMKMVSVDREDIIKYSVFSVRVSVRWGGAWEGRCDLMGG